MTPLDQYPSLSLTKIQEQPVGKAKFKEPVFRMGQFQDRYIEVEVSVYPLSANDPETEERLVGVRFGQMNIIRFIDPDLLYEIDMDNPK